LLALELPIVLGLIALCAADAGAQTSSSLLFSPSVPELATQRSGSRSAAAPNPLPARIASGAGESGFDSTGTARKQRAAKRKAAKTAEAKPPTTPSAPAPSPGPPQQAGGHTIPPQVAARAPYAEAYRPPDAPPRRPPRPEIDAFEPLGLRYGSFLVKPSVEITRGHDTNPARTPGGKASDFTLVAPELLVRSLWSVHEVGAVLRGSYSAYDQVPSSDRPLIDARAFARVDVSRDTRVDLEGRFFLSTEHPGSPNLQADLAKLPVFMTVGSAAGFTQRFNHLELMARASLDTTKYQDSELTDGTTASNRDRDYEQYTGALRLSYEIIPGVKPFVEVGADARRHELDIDRNGFARDSRGVTPRIGTTFDPLRKLTGEASVGYLVRRYDDPLLPELAGVVADALLIWRATGLTTATLIASSRAEESTVPFVSGALRRDATLQIDHAFRRWLIGTLRFGYGDDRYIGNGRHDTRTSLAALVLYKLSREVALKGEYRHETLRSNAANADYDADVFMLGLKLQR
jgi:hypothetical protein